MSIINMYFSPVGRIRRRDYWLYSLAMSIAFLLINLIVHQFVFGLETKNYFQDGASWMTLHPTSWGLYILIVNLLLLWPGICLAAKRWHDRNKTGWIAPAIAAVSYAMILGQIYLRQDGQINNTVFIIILGVVAFGAGVWQFVECGCLDGTKGPNKYGPSPKGIGNSADVF